MNSNNKLDWIQALRGFASMLVVLGHAHYFLKDTPSWNFAVTLLRPGGFIGVDLFFLISGFVMIYTTQNSNGSLKYSSIFWIKRISRILPVYFVLTFFYIAVWKDLSWLLNGSNWINLFKSFIFLPVSQNPPFFGMPNPIGWTLNYEMYFYLFFGATLLASNIKNYVLIAFIAITTIALPLASKGYVSADVINNYQFSIKYLNMVASPLIWTFGFGAITGILYISFPKQKNKFLMQIILWASITIAIWWCYSGMSSFHGLNNVGLPLFLAFTVIALTSKTLHFHLPNWSIWLGNISFSLYLVHPIAQGMMTRIVNEIIHRPELEYSWSQVIASTMLSLILATISHRYLEIKLSAFAQQKMLLLANRIKR